MCHIENLHNTLEKSTPCILNFDSMEGTHICGIEEPIQK